MPQAYKLINILQKLFAVRAGLPCRIHWLVCGWLLLVAPPTLADVVKPALVEISISTDGTYKVELRASIEALLTGINARYRDTREAPNGAAYDELRILEADELAAAFAPFKADLTTSIRLEFDGSQHRWP